MAKDNTLFLSAVDYDIYTIRKVAAINSHLGEIRVHDAEGGYLLTFCGSPGMSEERISTEFQNRLSDFTQNIWSH